MVTEGNIDGSYVVKYSHLERRDIFSAQVRNELSSIQDVDNEKLRKNESLYKGRLRKAQTKNIG